MGNKMIIRDYDDYAKIVLGIDDSVPPRFTAADRNNALCNMEANVQAAADGIPIPYAEKTSNKVSLLAANLINLIKIVEDRKKDLKYAHLMRYKKLRDTALKFFDAPVDDRRGLLEDEKLYTADDMKRANAIWTEIIELTNLLCK